MKALARLMRLMVFARWVAPALFLVIPPVVNAVLGEVFGRRKK
jgi:hypothetical protein